MGESYLPKKQYKVAAAREFVGHGFHSQQNLPRADREVSASHSSHASGPFTAFIAKLLYLNMKPVKLTGERKTVLRHTIYFLCIHIDSLVYSKHASKKEMISIEHIL